MLSKSISQHIAHILMGISQNRKYTPLTNACRPAHTMIEPSQRKTDLNISMCFLCQANVSYVSSENIWNGSYGRLHAANGFPTSRRQKIQVRFIYQMNKIQIYTFLGKYFVPVNISCSGVGQWPIVPVDVQPTHSRPGTMHFIG
jgi:hypothetical protein